MLHKYAQMVLKTGINLQKGQCLMIAGEPVHWELANIIEAEAYRMGAKLVDFELVPMQSMVNRSLYQDEAYLDFIPAFATAKIKERVEDRWSLLYLEGMNDPELAKKIDQERNAVTVKAIRTMKKPLQIAQMAGICSWCISPSPTDGWARQMGLKNKEELWKVLVPILKLDHADPGTAWKEQSDRLQRRAKTLNEMSIDYLHYTGPGTDLKIYVNPYAEWSGGGWTNCDDITTLPNIPTEEVYSVPDYRKTEGKVKITRPVEVLGDHVQDAWFEFKRGALVDYGASYGKHLLDQFLTMDEKARFLGEVALVDGNSPIFQSGKIFHSILFDENASCHIALGSGIRSAIKGSDSKSEEELDQLGCNKSILHTDFMVGSEEISIVARTRSGKNVPVIENGRFVGNLQ